MRQDVQTPKMQPREAQIFQSDMVVCDEGVQSPTKALRLHDGGVGVRTGRGGGGGGIGNHGGRRSGGGGEHACREWAASLLLLLMSLLLLR